MLIGAALVLVLAAPEVAAQGVSPHHPSTSPGTAGDGASTMLGGGEGTIRGHLVHRDREAPEVGTEVILYALAADGNAGLRRTTSDAEGRFRFEGIPNDAGHVYLVSVRVGGIPYGARLAFEPGESERVVEIEILSTTLQFDGIEAGGAHIRLQQGCTHLRIWHRHTLTNITQRVVYIPPELRGEHEPLLQVEVAAEAAILVGATGMELEVEAGVARYWGPLYPGRQEVEFGYGLPIQGEEIALELRTSLGASQLEVEIPSALGPPRGKALQAPADTQAGDPRPRLYTGPRLEPQQDFRWRQPVARRPETPALALATPLAQFWIELDDAVMDVSESHQIRVPAPLPESDLPLLCIALPQQVRNPRFSSDSLRWGLSREPSGILALHGPLPAGESVISFRYDLPVLGEPLHFERDFTTPLDRLEVVVADNGIAPQTRRLHPLRPLHSGGRNYLRLEAFAIEPGEVVSMEFARLQNVARSPGRLAALATGLGALAAVGFLIAPLLAGRRREGDPPESSIPRSEREAIYRTLDDLDEDLETGKLSPKDHQQMRGELRARAISLLREERGNHATASVATQCPGCGRAIRADDRFCSQCGRALAAPSPSRASDP